MAEDEDPRGGRVDADRLEEDWDRALNAASDAVKASGRANTLAPADAAAQVERIQSQRKWLSSFRPTLRKLFPLRRRRPE